MAKRMTTEEFIEKATPIMGKDSFLKTNLENRDENGKVIITCLKHGDYKITPTKYLQGQRCSKCSGKNKTTEEFMISLREYPPL